MACFVAPAGAAIVTSVARQVVKRKEGSVPAAVTPRVQWKWTRRLGWLNTMLWGGSALLALEHVWRGELALWPPFLTALNTPQAVGPMLREIATTGVYMTALVVFAWAALVAIAELRMRRATRSQREADSPLESLQLGFLGLILGGSALMWSVDRAVVYVTEGGPFIEPGAHMLAFGACAFSFALFIWLTRVFMTERGRLLRAFSRR